MTKFNVTPGSPYPRTAFGATVENDGVMFRIFSRHAERVWLLFFDNSEDKEPAVEIEFDPKTHRSGDIWHLHIQGILPGQLYLYRMDGPNDIEKGRLFNSAQWLLDPYALAITGCNDWGSLDAKKRMLQNLPRTGKFYSAMEFAGLPKCVVVDNRFDWEGDRHLRRPAEETIIYEAHVRGMTIHPGSAFNNPGTYKALVETIPHLKELGITTLELLPIQEFNELELDRVNPEAGGHLFNYWGYSTVGFYAPNGQYSGSGVTGGQVTEFCEMVKQFHKAGIEVLLDVVFNHTAEGNQDGPVYSFKGIDNSIYYLYDKGEYKNYSGCGNTFNCNHPYVRRFIINCLRYWVLYMHVDGFRFDLASILGRDQNGELMENPPLIESIAEDPVLRDSKLIAEAWDAGGAYQVGSFPGERWAEWNGKFRDDVRSFMKGDPNSRPAFAYRFTGSSDLYKQNGRTPLNSINFITSHDGFTLNDLVSYKEKHNEVNGEGGRDGDNYNLSDNNGIEGVTDDPEINKVRTRQIKNFLTVLMLSQGVPMLTAGDEFKRTQSGNNNAYCQDNEISWIDWSLKEKNREIFDFCCFLTAFRKRHSVFRRSGFFTGKAPGLYELPDISWFDIDGKAPDWEEDSHTLACLINGRSSEKHSREIGDDFFIMFNTGSKNASFKIPDAPLNKNWYITLNTSNNHPDDFYRPGTEISLNNANRIELLFRSIAVLIAK